MRSEKGQTTFEFIAIFTSVAVLVILGVAGLEKAYPPMYGAIVRDLKCTARDVTWAANGMSLSKTRASLQAEGEGFMASMAPKRLGPGANPLQKLDVALR